MYMKKKMFLLFFIAMGCGLCQAQDLRVMNFKELNSVISRRSDTIRIVNFWATWCKPCVGELHDFVKLQKELSKQKIQFIFVSMDFLSQTQKVKEAIQRLGMQGMLVQLNEKGGDWIDSLDKNWGGALPYTVLIRADNSRAEHYE